MDLYAKKEDLETDIIFDLVVNNNSLETDNTYLTASLLCIFTDGSKRQIGTQIDGKVLGNIEYNLDKLTDDNIKAWEDGILESLQWLINDSIVVSIEIESKKNGNRLDTRITFTNDTGNQDNLIFSLDENMEILDNF